MSVRRYKYLKAVVVYSLNNIKYPSFRLQKFIIKIFN